MPTPPGPALVPVTYGGRCTPEGMLEAYTEPSVKTSHSSSVPLAAPWSSEEALDATGRAGSGPSSDCKSSWSWA